MGIATFASAALVVLGAVFAALGFLLAGSVLWVVIGLLAVFGGGVLSVAAGRPTLA
jgi:hypothetical protein